MPEAPTTKTWAALAMTLLANSAYTTLATSDRFTGSDGARMDERLKTVEMQYRGLPPTWLISDLAEIKKLVEDNRRSIHAMATRLEVLNERNTEQ